MTIRLLQMMCGIVLGEEMEQLSEEDKGLARDIMKRLGTGIMISPLVDLELTDELRRKERLVSPSLAFWAHNLARYDCA